MGWVGAGGGGGGLLWCGGGGGAGGRVGGGGGGPPRPDCAALPTLAVLFDEAGRNASGDQGGRNTRPGYLKRPASGYRHCQTAARWQVAATVPPAPELARRRTGRVLVSRRGAGRAASGPGRNRELSSEVQVVHSPRLGRGLEYSRLQAMEQYQWVMEQRRQCWGSKPVPTCSQGRRRCPCTNCNLVRSRAWRTLRGK